MANVFSPFGFKWWGLNNSPATPSDAMIPAKVANGDTQKIYRGDGVKKLATGYVSAIVAAGTVASQWAGIFWGCEYLSLSQGKTVVSPTWPGGDAVGDVDVLLLPLIGATPALLLAQVSGASPIAFLDQGANCDIAYQAGVAFSGWSKSGASIAFSTLGTTPTLPFRVVAPASRYFPAGYPNCDDTSINNLVVVQFNAMQESGI